MPIAAAAVAISFSPTCATLVRLLCSFRRYIPVLTLEAIQRAVGPDLEVPKTAKEISVNEMALLLATLPGLSLLQFLEEVCVYYGVWVLVHCRRSHTVLATERCASD